MPSRSDIAVVMYCFAIILLTWNWCTWIICVLFISTVNFMINVRATHYCGEIRTWRQYFNKSSTSGHGWHSRNTEQPSEVWEQLKGNWMEGQGSEPLQLQQHGSRLKQQFVAPKRSYLLLRCQNRCSHLL